MHFVLIFSFITIVPLVLVSIFCTSFINAGIESWFAKSAKQALYEAKAVADAYIKEHKRSIKNDANTISNHFSHQINVLLAQTDLFEVMLNDILEQRKINEALIFQESSIIARSYFSFLLEMEKISENDLKRADAGETVIYVKEDRIRALVLLSPQQKIYMLIGKIVDKEILSHVKATEESLNSYNRIYDQRFGLQMKFIAFFALIIILLLLFAIWIGFNILDVLLKPIRNWIKGAESVSTGDLTVRLESMSLHNELDDLTVSFNTMVSQLQKQQHELKISQSKATWADAARRIAHEIKNPLTPIQLAAERLKRKYMTEIISDQETFSLCIETIIRQVESIKKLVQEFSNFTKNSKLNIETVNIYELIGGVILLQKQSNPAIEFKLNGNKNCYLACDPLQMNQVFTNLMLNSVNALLEDMDIKTMKVNVTLTEDDLNLIITVVDNGPGFPAIGKEKLFEPYYTTREKGTGLGLSIVSSIVSAHGGFVELLNLNDAQEGVACVKIVFPKRA